MDFQRYGGRFFCRDGFSVSVVWGYGTNSGVGRNGDIESYELGYPSSADSLIAEFAEDSSDPTNTIYGWVPADIVQQLIQSHGGLRDSRRHSQI